MFLYVNRLPTKKKNNNKKKLINIKMFGRQSKKLDLSHTVLRKDTDNPQI